MAESRRTRTLALGEETEEMASIDDTPGFEASVGEATGQPGISPRTSAETVSPPPTLRDCAQLLGRYLREETRYVDSLPDQHRVNQALMLHDDGNISMSWSILVTLIDGLYGPITVQPT